MRSKNILWVLTALMLNACNSIPQDERGQLRDEIDLAAEQALAGFYAADASLEHTVNAAPGYFVASAWSGMFGAIGGRQGVGVLYDADKETRTYMNMRSLELGAGVGATDIRYLVVIDSQDIVDEVRGGTWSVGFDSQAILGESDIYRQDIREGVTAYMRSEAGASIAASAGLTRIKVNSDLTDLGVGDVSIPNIGLSNNDEQGDAAPRIWPHKFPYLAQDVIDLGYDLPQPYGLGFTYVDIEQDMLLENISVGFNGGEKSRFEFVTFENAITDTESTQFKADLWILPFMNVFTNIGKVKGRAIMDIFLDGNLMLEELEEDCSGLVPSLRCALLQDQTILLPITAKVDAQTWGVGTVLAGGWNDWFTAVPLNITYTDTEDTDIDGYSFTFTPRVGRMVGLGNYGNLAVFVGGNYLDSSSNIDGVLAIPGTDFTIDYTLEQSNVDRWNYVVGFNWDINKNFSWVAEYNGFGGSREALITALTWRL